MRYRNAAIDMAADAAAFIRSHARLLTDNSSLDPLIARIGDARIVMLGEASHGTHEYYTWRSRISRRLIEEKGFSLIAVEGDWPDCYRVNRYIKGHTDEKDAADVLAGFTRWPTWMWANWETAALAEWLKAYNQRREPNRQVGFYGLDVYSLWESMDALLHYLEKVDPQSLKVAQQAFRCFEPYRGEDGLGYAAALRLAPELCEDEAAKLLLEIQSRMPRYDHDYEAVFNAKQNAFVMVNAEGYYRAMLRGNGASWNARDRHMQDTLERLLEFHGPDAKVIVWEHNTHIGDARFTDMDDNGMYNIGTLARDKWGREEVVLVGFGSYEGTVIAGRSWGAAMEVMPLPKGIRGSWEEYLHLSGPEDKLLIMDEFRQAPFAAQWIGHRAVGVVYNPEYDGFGNYYVPSVVTDRYDAFLFINSTKGLHPLHLKPRGHLMPDTYPFGV